MRALLVVEPAQNRQLVQVLRATRCGHLVAARAVQ